jgi:hypothetical protein
MYEDRTTNAEITRPYCPAAIFYEESDSLEYVRRDVPCVYRRIDMFLTLILSMSDRTILGFRLKGFKHLYLHRFQAKIRDKKIEFPLLVSVLEEVMSELGSKVFDEQERLSAYAEAKNIAEQDRVVFKDFTKVA